MARHALLVGVSNFTDKRLATLNAPPSDLQALSVILADPERGGFDSVTRSLDEDFMVVRDKLATLFDNRDPDDFLLLYYSGHGILGRGNRLFLATPGSDLDKPQVRGVSAREIREQMDQSRAERQVMVLDCCHSGAFADGAKGAAATAVTQDTFDSASAGRFVLAAADALQFAWDGDKLKEGETAERKLSKFTSWIVDGLGRGEAAPDDDQITMDALFRYVSRRAKADNSPAVPQRYVDRDTGDLVIGRNPAAAGPAWQDLVRQLDDADWSVRAQAVEAVGKLLSRQGPVGRAAQGALDERLGSERDFKVRNRIKELLGVGAGPANPDKDGGLPPQPPPPPPPGPKHEVYQLNDRESAVLVSLGVARETWGTLPAPVMERVRLYAKALRNTRWLLWSTVAVVFFDIGALSNIHDRTMERSAAGGMFMVQMLSGILGLVPFIRRPVGASVVPGFEAIMTRYSIVRWAGWQLYETQGLRRLSVAILVSAVVGFFVGSAL